MTKGYVYLQWKIGPQYYIREFEHRIVAGLAGTAARDIHVHHKNGQTDDNSLDNLEVLTPGEHARRHAMVDMQAAATMYINGMGLRQIAAAMNVDSGHLSRQLRKRGVEMRPRRRQPTPIDHDKVRTLFNDGLGAIAIANRLGATQAVVRRAMRELCLRRRPGRVASTSLPAGVRMSIPCHEGLTHYALAIIGTATQTFVGEDGKSYLDASQPLRFIKKESA